MTAKTDRRLVDTIAAYQPVTARDVARHVVVTGLALAQRLSGRQAEGLARNRVHFLYLHSVFRDEEAGFRRLVATLAETHKLITYSEGVRRVRSGEIDQPYVTFSFDDGMYNNLAAARILDEHGAKGCFFVCSDIVGERRFEQLEQFCRGRLEFAPTAFMDWSEVEDLIRRGHEIGSHTRSHRRLSTLDAAALEDEVAGSRQALVERIGAVAHFAWPYGRFSDVPAGLGEVVARAGYASCASACRGCHVAAAGAERAALCLRRDQIGADWPLAHARYFMAKSAASASASDNRWPQTLE